MTKREFLIKGGSVLLVLPAGWSLSGCDDDDEGKKDAAVSADSSAGVDTASPAADAPVARDTAAAGPETGVPEARPPADTAGATEARPPADTAAATDTRPPPDAGAPARDAAPSAMFLRYTSTLDNAHTHDFTISMAALQSPPATGVMGNTTLVAAHVHEVALTAAELMSIAGGQTVNKTSSSVAGHTHSFAFSRAGGTPTNTQ
jgi:hypothetical protein